jgi:hypothetical protein
MLLFLVHLKQGCYILQHLLQILLFYSFYTPFFCSYVLRIDIWVSYMNSNTDNFAHPYTPFIMAQPLLSAGPPTSSTMLVVVSSKRQCSKHENIQSIF